MTKPLRLKKGDRVVWDWRYDITFTVYNTKSRGHWVIVMGSNGLFYGDWRENFSKLPGRKKK